MSAAALKELLDQHAATVAQQRQAAAPLPASRDALIEIFDAARDLTSAPASMPGLTLKRRPSVTGLLQTFRFRDPPSRFITEEDLALGRAVHRACELDDQDDLDERTLHERVKPYLNGFRKFRAEISAMRSIAWELDITSARMGLRGRLDNLRWVRGKRALIDIKTNGADEATPLQLALYDVILRDSPLQIEHADEWFALVLQPDRYRFKRVEPADMTRHRADAVALCRTYHALARMRGTID